MQARALVDFGELNLDRAMGIYGPIGDLSFFRGHYYPSKAPFLSFAAVPIYWTLRVVTHSGIGGVPEIPLVFTARLFLTVLPTLIILILIRRFLVSYVSPEISDVLTVFYGLGTLALSYSLLFMSHQTTAALLFASFYLLWRWSRSEKQDGFLVAAGALAALAVAAEYTSALCAGLLALYLFLAARNRKRSPVLAAGLFGAGAVPILALLGAYHWMCFGGPLETGYRHLADAAYQPWHLGGFLGIRTPDPRAFWLSLFSPLRGFFVLSPGLLLGLFGLLPLWRARSDRPELGPLAIFTAILLLGYFYFTASFSYASWGWTTGPRHLTGLVPFLLAPTALLLASTRDPLRLGLSLGLLCASVLVTAALTLVNYIPDDVSEAVFGLTVPLARSGNWVPSVLNFLGWANPAPGILLSTLPLLAAMGLVWTLAPKARAGTYLVGTGVILGVVLSWHALSFQDTPQDRGALTLMRNVWLAPSGHSLRFWSWDGGLPAAQRSQR
jgi:hypothetical protein